MNNLPEASNQNSASVLNTISNQFPSCRAKERYPIPFPTFSVAVYISGKGKGKVVPVLH
jgi:hypothetical protein